MSSHAFFLLMSPKFYETDAIIMPFRYEQSHCGLEESRNELSVSQFISGKASLNCALEFQFRLQASWWVSLWNYLILSRFILIMERRRLQGLQLPTEIAVLFFLGPHLGAHSQLPLLLGVTMWLRPQQRNVTGRDFVPLPVLTYKNHRTRGTSVCLSPSSKLQRRPPPAWGNRQWRWWWQSAQKPWSPHECVEKACQLPLRFPSNVTGGIMNYFSVIVCGGV